MLEELCAWTTEVLAFKNSRAHPPSGYYFTNLSCALNFIQNMNADSLKMREEEFEAYTSGRQVAPMRQSTSSSVSLTSRIRTATIVFSQ